jgi:DNA-directed RNA polymerase subunit H
VAKQIDVTGHELVPKHEVMAKKEKEALLKKMGIRDRDLPKITSDDPALIGMEVKPGDVIRITRESQTAGHVFYYRVVV